MSSHNIWTEEQLSAIDAAKGNLLISAAAGAGKTAVLVERIIRKVKDAENPIDIDRLLVVTFTNAAAAEMKERIGEAIAKELNQNPYSKHLSRQLALLNRAYILTIHSFCLEVVRQNFYKLDLDPSFRIANETESELLKLEVLEQVFEKNYDQENNDSFLSLVEFYGGQRDDAPLQNLVLKLYEFAQSNPWPEDWLRQAAKKFKVSKDTDLDSLDWSKSIIEDLKIELDGMQNLLLTALKLAELPGGPKPYIKNLKDDLVVISDLQRSCETSWNEAYKCFNSVEFSRLKRCPKDVDDRLKERVKTLRDEVKKRINNLKDELFKRPPEECIKDLISISPVIDTLIELVVEFGKEYHKAKKARGLVDFSDLEHYCLDILLSENAKPGELIPSSTAGELRERFEEILIDEYQDINAVQEAILNLISKQGSDCPNMFMVGDVKQSIYRFRLACPELFLNKYLEYPNTSETSERRIDLTKNFRSRKEVLDGVNFVFRQIMSRRIGEIEYDKKAELVYNADYPAVSDNKKALTGPVELHIIEKNDDLDRENPQKENSDEEEKQSSEDIEELDTAQKEARTAAKIIREIMAAGKKERYYIYDKKRKIYRYVQYRDIVVLLRATKNWGNTFLEEFRVQGIPSYAEISSGYFDATEVQVVIALLRIIDNPRQDIPLAGLLRSPIVGLNAEELAEIRLCKPEMSFYDALLEAAKRDDELKTLSRKCRDFLKKLENWRTMARQGRLSDLIWTLYRETGYYDYVGCMPGGAQRQANLRALYDRAQQYERTTFRGLFQFLNFLERIQDSGNDLGAARALGENEDVVRIMSIHKSKGLEFPVVIVAGLGKQFNMKDLNQDVLLHKNLGLGPNFVDPHIRLKYPTIAKTAIKRRLKLETLSEEMRLLYVAMTRAREKLILMGSVKDVAVSAAKWCYYAGKPDWQIPETETASAKTCLDWICPAIARHPGGEPLRKLAHWEGQLPAEMVKDDSVWSVYIHRSLQQRQDNSKEAADYSNLLKLIKKFSPIESQSEYKEIVGKNLSWSYPYSKIAGRPAKISVSELKDKLRVEYVEDICFPLYLSQTYLRPQFLKEAKGLTAAEQGSVVHIVMQHINLKGSLDEEGIKSQVSEMVNQEILTEKQALSVDCSKIAGFFRTDLGCRVTASNKVLREIPFSLGVWPGEFYPNLQGELDKNERIILQGIIDLLFYEGDEVVLVDFKTDRVTPEQLQNVKQRYNIQIGLYEKAVKEILKKPVKGKYLYLFHPGIQVEM
ncbi:MAG: ATP-dependent helicase/nuclease subunit [Thermosediminibacterales bacterium]|nr:ATP-dependent helicase/nuclease subunit [Thermosediminibacterales bacterium]MDK2835283.1 ATP-dependent helicase/nuclease subunit [Thermosediminibacterales bacterium]